MKTRAPSHDYAGSSLDVLVDGRRIGRLRGWGGFDVDGGFSVPRGLSGGMFLLRAEGGTRKMVF